MTKKRKTTTMMKKTMKKKTNKFIVYKTKNNSIFVIGSKNSRVKSIFDGNIPPSPAERIASFTADSTCDYIHNMIPILMEHLPNDKEIIEIYKQIKKNGV